MPSQGKNPHHHESESHSRPLFRDQASRMRTNAETNLEDLRPGFQDQVRAPKDSPNIVVIMTDDVGFGAASTFGGPANTPNMSKIGEEGLTFNHFHTTSICSATRAALLTGRHPHNIATGYVVDDDADIPGYCSQIPKSCATVADNLRMNGYSTGWFGKNHNGPIWESSASGPFDQWPTGMGFDRFYGFNGCDSNQYHPLIYDDTVPIQPSIDNNEYHVDKDLADQAIQFIEERNKSTPDKPFFLYYVPGATHAPYHVPESWSDKYKGKFSMGWDRLREQTLENQKKLGIAPKTTKLMPRPDEIPSWESIESEEDRELYCRMLEVYCGFLEMTDHNIGRILNHIDEIGETNNTLVIYIQGDNGGSAEGSIDGTAEEIATMFREAQQPKDLSLDSKEDLDTGFLSNHMPISWAWALNSPMQWSKSFSSHFGATRNGMVVRWPNQIKDKGGIRSQFHHVIDIAPTLMDAAGIYPRKIINDTPQSKIDGVSMLYTFNPKNSAIEKRHEMIFELSGNRGFYKDGWMLSSTPVSFPWIPDQTGGFKEYETNWELYNVNEDFSQAHNYLNPKHNPSEKILAIKESMSSRLIELSKENYELPLCFSSEQLNEISVRKSILTGYGRFEYANNLIRVPEPCAPDCKNVSFTIDAHIDVPDNLGWEGLEGVIVSMGGKFCGFGLLVLDGFPVWVYNLAHWPDAIFKIEGKEKLSEGKHVITVKHDYEGGDSLGGPGTFTMYVDGDKAGSVYVHKTVKEYFSLSESMDIGQDTGSPLVEYYQDIMPFNFNGDISKVIFDVDNSNLSEKTKCELENARCDYLAAFD